MNTTNRVLIKNLIIYFLISATLNWFIVTTHLRLSLNFNDALSYMINPFTSISNNFNVFLARFIQIMYLISILFKNVEFQFNPGNSYELVRHLRFSKFLNHHLFQTFLSTIFLSLANLLSLILLLLFYQFDKTYNLMTYQNIFINFILLSMSNFSIFLIGYLFSLKFHSFFGLTGSGIFYLLSVVISAFSINLHRGIHLVLIPGNSSYFVDNEISSIIFGTKLNHYGLSVVYFILLTTVLYSVIYNYYKGSDLLPFKSKE